MTKIDGRTLDHKTSELCNVPGYFVENISVPVELFRYEGRPGEA